jgi:hypothetical protein
MNSAPEEQEGLKLVSDLVDEVTNAFKSLVGKKHEGTFDTYRFYSAKHLHRAADGFVFLRRAGRITRRNFLFVRRLKLRCGCRASGNNRTYFIE